MSTENQTGNTIRERIVQAFDAAGKPGRRKFVDYMSRVMSRSAIYRYLRSEIDVGTAKASIMLRRLGVVMPRARGLADVRAEPPQE